MWDKRREQDSGMRTTDKIKDSSHLVPANCSTENQQATRPELE
jgi:hypothetical protein